MTVLGHLISLLTGKGMCCEDLRISTPWCGVSGPDTLYPLPKTER